AAIRSRTKVSTRVSITAQKPCRNYEWRLRGSTSGAEPADSRVVSTSSRQVLEEVFGHREFRPGQEEVMEAQLAGRDVLSVAPTGSGKSISYWVPAVVAGGLTLVISPLIALMKDQVDRLRSLGVQAAFVNSSQDRAEQVASLRAAAEGQL